MKTIILQLIVILQAQLLGLDILDNGVIFVDEVNNYNFCEVVTHEDGHAVCDDIFSGEDARVYVEDANEEMLEGTFYQAHFEGEDLKKVVPVHVDENDLEIDKETLDFYNSMW